MSPLGRRIADLIRAEGPIPLDRYMALALTDPTHGYYATRAPIGAAGDFVTAPEISQMFGEMIGLWMVEVWRRMGAPGPVSIVELGPGRGTLMADMLGTLRIASQLRENCAVHLVELGRELRARQREKLAGFGVPITWHDTLATVPTGPMVLIANEFLDALPIRQFEKRRGRFHERMVGLDASDSLALGLAPDPSIEPALARHVSAPEGAIVEISLQREEVTAEIARRCVSGPGAALIIDYGFPAGGYGDTFQAVAAHVPVDPFAAPGETDLTSHVDFHALVAATRSLGAEAWGPMAQGAFLRVLGMGLRAERLAAGKDETIRAEIASAFHRLTAPEEMGTLFQVLAIGAPGLPAPPPFG